MRKFLLHRLGCFKASRCRRETSSLICPEMAQRAEENFLANFQYFTSSWSCCEARRTQICLSGEKLSLGFADVVLKKSLIGKVESALRHPKNAIKRPRESSPWTLIKNCPTAHRHHISQWLRTIRPRKGANRTDCLGSARLTSNCTIIRLAPFASPLAQWTCV